jgi:sphingosine kinase
VLESAFLVARGNAIWIDLGRYQTTDKSYTSFLTFTWGMIADLDIESEVVRFLGSLRIDLWAVLCVIRGRRYRGRLSYLPATSTSSNSQHSQDSPSNTRNVLHPTLSDPVTSDWIVIEDEFILLWTSQVTHAAENTYHSPRSHLQDGVFQIMVLRGKKMRRWDIARILLSLESGGHVHHPAVEIIECIAFRLEPLCQGSYNVLDGEVIQSGPVQGYVMPTCLQAFCQYPSIDSEKLKVD